MLYDLPQLLIDRQNREHLILASSLDVQVLFGDEHDGDDAWCQPYRLDPERPVPRRVRCNYRGHTVAGNDAKRRGQQQERQPGLLLRLVREHVDPDRHVNTYKDLEEANHES